MLAPAFSDLIVLLVIIITVIVIDGFGEPGERSFFYFAQNSGISELAEAAEMVVERVSVNVRFSYDVGNRYFVIFTFVEQFPKCIFQTFFGWQNL